MSENPRFEEQKEKATKILMTMFDYLGLEASIRVEDKGSKIAIKIASEDAGRIIGRKGQTLESLQLILNRIMFREEDECPHMMLDIDGYSRGAGRDRRSDFSEENGDGNEERFRRRRSEGRRRDGEEGGFRVNEEQLRTQAQDAAKEVKRWGEAVTLPKMNARDRRIIHVTLQDDPEITTQSEGEGPLKKVVISLKKD